MALFTKKVSRLRCRECEKEIGIQCGECGQRIPPERHSSPNRYTCLCGHKCTSLECPYCHYTNDPQKFSVGAEIGRFEVDHRGSLRMGWGN